MPTIITILTTTRRAKVTQTLVNDDGCVPIETILEPGAAPRQFQIHRTSSIKVEELDTDRSEPLKA